MCNLWHNLQGGEYLVEEVKSIFVSIFRSYGVVSIFRSYGVVSMCIGTGMGAAGVFEFPGRWNKDVTKNNQKNVI